MVLALIDKPKRGLSGQDFQFTSPLRLRILVGGQIVREVSYKLEPGSENFHEIVFDVPAFAIKGDTLELTVGGDHIALDYWFYQ